MDLGTQEIQYSNVVITHINIRNNKLLHKNKRGQGKH